MTEEYDFSQYLLAPRINIQPTKGSIVQFKIGKYEEAWFDDPKYFLSQLKEERWLLRDNYDKENRDDGENAELSKTLMFLSENECTFLQGLANLMPKISFYFTETRIMLAYLIRDDSKHLHGLFTRMNDYKSEPSPLFQHSLKSVAELDNLSDFMFIACLLGKISIATITRTLATTLKDDPLAQLLSHIAEDEELHTSLAISHIRYKLSRNPGFKERMKELVNQHELYLVASTGMEETYEDAIRKMLGDERTRETLMKISRERKLKLLEAGLTERDAELALEPIMSERRGVC